MSECPTIVFYIMTYSIIHLYASDLSIIQNKQNIQPTQEKEKQRTIIFADKQEISISERLIAQFGFFSTSIHFNRNVDNDSPLKINDNNLDQETFTFLIKPLIIANTGELCDVNMFFASHIDQINFFKNWYSFLLLSNDKVMQSLNYGFVDSIENENGQYTNSFKKIFYFISKKSQKYTVTNVLDLFNTFITYCTDTCIKCIKSKQDHEPIDDQTEKNIAQIIREALKHKYKIDILENESKNNPTENYLLEKWLNKNYSINEEELKELVLNHGILDCSFCNTEQYYHIIAIINRSDVSHINLDHANINQSLISIRENLRCLSSISCRYMNNDNFLLSENNVPPQKTSYGLLHVDTEMIINGKQFVFLPLHNLYVDEKIEKELKALPDYTNIKSDSFYEKICYLYKITMNNTTIKLFCFLPFFLHYCFHMTLCTVFFCLREESLEIIYTRHVLGRILLLTAIPFNMYQYNYIVGDKTIDKLLLTIIVAEYIYYFKIFLSINKLISYDISFITCFLSLVGISITLIRSSFLDDHFIDHHQLKTAQYIFTKKTVPEIIV